MAKKKQFVPSEITSDTVPLLPGQWHPKTAYAAANMADEVSDRLVAVLALLDYLCHRPTDVTDGGYTLWTVRDLVASCQTDLRKSIEWQPTEGGVR